MDCILYLLAFSVCMFLFGMALQGAPPRSCLRMFTELMSTG